MAKVLVGGAFVRAQLVCLAVDQVSINTFFFNVLNSPTPTATDQDLAAYLDANTAPLVKPLLENNATYRGYVTQILDITGSPLYPDQNANTNAGAGTAGAVALPRQSCGITSWYTDTPGRKGRGRTYWPFPATAADSGNGVPSAAYVTAADTLAAFYFFLAAFTQAGRSATLAFRLYQRKTKAFSPITTRLTRAVWATQRRRGSYGRQNLPPV